MGLRVGLFPRLDQYLDFPGGPVVKTCASTAGGAGLIPGQGAKIPCAM